MSSTEKICVRRAEQRDLRALSRLSSLLVRLHHRLDSDRFPAVEEEYSEFLGSQLERLDAVIYVAEDDGKVVGYIFAALEPLSWKELREPAGFIHDLIVEEASRGLGIAGRLAEAASVWLETQGAARIMLGTAARNENAQRFFERLGFRRTMIEMTRERR
jgi:ribosomal protein S18 acetylase RimI-like enzyme